MIALIVARSKNNVIGKNGRIPWQIPGEQSQFKELTTGNLVIMGRKPYEEIGHPLLGRKTIVLSTTKKFQGPDLATTASLKEALELAAKGFAGPDQNIYIAGGCSLYKEALPLVDAMFITEVQIKVPGGDTFFPDFDPADFYLTVEQTSGEKIKYTRTLYTRKNHNFTV